MEDLKEACKSQLKRLAHLDGFPKHSEAIADYLSALSVAKTAERVQRVVGAFTGDAELQRCPTAAQLRIVAYDTLNREEVAQKHCEKCSGSGFVVVWRLVTYQGKSFTIKRSEKIDERDIAALADKLNAEQIPGADRQMILSAAANCECRKF